MLTRRQCIEILDKTDMLPHIRRHSQLVAEVALLLGRLLETAGLRLDLHLIECGALLHDVGKGKSLTTGEDHAALGSQMLEGIVHPATARIVREHIHLERSQVEGQLTESLLVNYSDKRVKHEEVVSLEDRFYDLIARYAKNPIHRDRLLDRLRLYQELEKNIFSHLSVSPQGPEIMGLNLKFRKGAASNDHGNQETDFGIAGRG